MKTLPMIDTVPAPPSHARRPLDPPARTAAGPYRAYKPRAVSRARNASTRRCSSAACTGEPSALPRRRWRTSATRCRCCRPRRARTCSPDARSPTSASAARRASPPAISPTSCARRRRRSAPRQVSKQFVYVTFGSCGACRFGQYHQSYELALRNVGLESFRMFLLGQGDMRAGTRRRRRARVRRAVHARHGLGHRAHRRRAGLRVSDAPVRGDARARRRAWRAGVASSICTRCSAGCPAARKTWSALAWHLSTRYFTNAHARGAPPVRRASRSIDCASSRS